MTAVAVKSADAVAEKRGEFVPEPSWYARPMRSSGPESITLSVGASSLTLEGFSAEQVLTLKARYGIFARLEPTAGRPDMRVSVRIAGAPHFLQVQAGPGQSEYYRIETRWSGEALIATSYEWAAWINLAEGVARVALADSALTDPRGFDRSLENFLRLACAHLATERGGFLLHSAGLVLDGQAYLFFGPSGSGKTTVTTLTPEAHILSDDLTLIERETPDVDSRFVACSVPFRGVFAPEATAAARWPVAGFYRLVQALEDRVEIVTGARAVGELMGSLPFVTERTEMAGTVLDVVARAASRHAVARLHFRKDRTFWSVLRPVPVGSEAVPVDSFHGSRGIRP